MATPKWYKRRITYVIGVPALLVCLIAGAVNGTPDAPVASPETVEPTVEPEVPETPEPETAEPTADATPRTVGLDILRDGWPYFDDVPDTTIDTAAHSICDAFDRGVTFDEYMAASDDIPTNEAGALAGYATHVYCTEYNDITNGN